jgi:hypothetical protein
MAANWVEKMVAARVGSMAEMMVATKVGLMAASWDH